MCGHCQDPQADTGLTPPLPAPGGTPLHVLRPWMTFVSALSSAEASSPPPHTATSGGCPFSTCISGSLSDPSRTPSICGCALRGAPIAVRRLLTLSPEAQTETVGDPGTPQGGKTRAPTQPAGTAGLGAASQHCLNPGGDPPFQDASRHIPSATVTSRDLLSSRKGRAVTRPPPWIQVLLRLTRSLLMSRARTLHLRTRNETLSLAAGHEDQEGSSQPCPYWDGT